MVHPIRRYLVLAACLLVLALLPWQATHAQTEQRCFAETGHCISGRIRTFWEANGGLIVFGLPITPQREEIIEGRPLQVQWFERNRLELHPENAPPYDVLLGRLGAEYVAQTGSPPPDTPKAECRYFEATGFNVCGDILLAWRASGIDLDGQPGKTEAENLALFGYPLTGEYPMTFADGSTHNVQWFERARFELHPQNNPPFNVQLGLLGREKLTPQAGAPGPVAPAPGGDEKPVLDDTDDAAQIEAAVRSHTGPVDFAYTIENVCIDREYATAERVPTDPNAADIQAYVLERIAEQWTVIYSGSGLALAFASTREEIGLPEDFACLPSPISSEP
jgi:hypothetical protein